jgi:D-alanyl-D-alanine carboxypeptidase
MTNSGFSVRLWRLPTVSLALLVGVALCLGLATTSEARGRHHGRHAHEHRRSITIYVSHHHHRGARQAYQRRHGRHHYARAESSGGGMTSPRGVAAIVVDGNSGRALFAVNENQPRHPASVTKVMTLYLLFEQLEKGH